MNYQILNQEILGTGKYNEKPFPFVVLDQVIELSSLNSVIKDFPTITSGGSFPPNELEYGPAFKQLISDLESEQFRSYISKLMDINLDNHPSVITVRGHSRAKDGRIHTDSKSKKITVLLYLNKDWQNPGGDLRLLNNGKNIDDFEHIVPSTAGTMLIFKVTDNCWHGYPGFVGQRLSLQLNYVADERVKVKQLKKHGLTAKIKSLFTTT